MGYLLANHECLELCSAVMLGPLSSPVNCRGTRGCIQRRRLAEAVGATDNSPVLLMPVQSRLRCAVTKILPTATKISYLERSSAFPEFTLTYVLP